MGIGRSAATARQRPRHLHRERNHRLRHRVSQGHHLRLHHRRGRGIPPLGPGGQLHAGGVGHGLRHARKPRDATRRRTRPPLRPHQALGAPAGRGGSGVARGGTREAVGLQRGGHRHQGTTQHHAQPGRRAHAAAGVAAAGVGRRGVGHAGDARRLQRAARQGVHRRRAAGRGGTGVRPQQHPRELRRAHRGVQGRGAGGLRGRCHRRGHQHRDQQATPPLVRGHVVLLRLVQHPQVLRARRADVQKRADVRGQRLPELFGQQLLHRQLRDRVRRRRHHREHRPQRHPPRAPLQRRVPQRGGHRQGGRGGQALGRPPGGLVHLEQLLQGDTDGRVPIHRVRPEAPPGTHAHPLAGVQQAQPAHPRAGRGAHGQLQPQRDAQHRHSFLQIQLVRRQEIHRRAGRAAC